MSMTTSVVAFISPDEDYKKHSKVLLACAEANVLLPKETAEYFGDDAPEEYLLEEKLEVRLPIIHEYSGEMEQGIEILISDIPKGVHKIRFVNSW